MSPTDLVVCLCLLLQVLPYPFADIKTEPPLPDGNAVWTLQLLSRGGLDGRGQGDILVNSKGTLECSRKKMDCEKKLAKVGIDELSRMIESMTPSMWSNSSLGTCYDCFSTMLRLNVRDRDGAVQIFSAYWDVTTQSRMSADLLKLYNAVRSVAADR